MARHRVLGISFDHIHMGDLLRLVADHPDAEIAGIYDPDPARMQSAIANFAIPQDRVFTDLEACLATTEADLAIVCSKTAEHANSVETIAPHGLNVLVEKPFAASVADARRMIAAMAAARRPPRHQLAARLVSLAQHGQAPDRRRADRRRHRGPFLRRQSRPALPSRRQGRGLARGGRAAEAGVVVVQEGRRRRQPARLSRLRHDARHLVPRRRGADRGDLHGRRDARASRSTSTRSPSAATPAACRSSRRGGARSPTRGRSSRSRNAASSSSAPTARSRATTTTITSPCRRGRIRRTRRCRSTRCRPDAAPRSSTCSPGSMTARRSPARSTRPSA